MTGEVISLTVPSEPDEIDLLARRENSLTERRLALAERHQCHHPAGRRVPPAPTLDDIERRIH